MPREKTPQIAFIGWNPFQFIHVAEIARALPGSYFLVEKRKDYVREFDESILTGWDVPVLIWHRRMVQELDGLFDVIVCQTPFSQAELFTKTRIAMIQYGYAKEVHNYGAWRSLADLCLVYGPYAAAKIGYFCPVAQVGMPRFDKWHDPAFVSQTKDRYAHLLNKSRKTILYMPTWGDLSTVDKYIDSVRELGDRYNVLLKLHHNTALLESSRKQKLSQMDGCVHFGANDDVVELLAVADIVLSDYSGAIFDAVYCRKPVVLLHDDIVQKVGTKMDRYSLEYAARERIGAIVENPALLGQVVDDVAAGKQGQCPCNDDLRTELFVDGPGATERAAEELVRLSRGEYEQTQLQSYIRREVRKSLAAKL